MPNQTYWVLPASNFVRSILALSFAALACGKSPPQLFTTLELNVDASSAGGAGGVKASASSTARAGSGMALHTSSGRDLDAGQGFDAGGNSALDAMVAAAATSSSGAGIADGSVSSETEPSETVGAGPHSGPFALAPEQRPASDGSCSMACTRAGGRCAAGDCIFDCDGVSGCQRGQVVCPSDSNCVVQCGDSACAGNIVCLEGASCDIHCAGASSCASELICEGNCNIVCSGEGSCAGGIGGSADSLDLLCSGRGSCGDWVQCERGPCAIACTGEQSCDRVVSYGQSNVVSCSGQASCEKNVYCSGGSCQVDCADNACAAGFTCEAPGCSAEGY